MSQCRPKSHYCVSDYLAYHVLSGAEPRPMPDPAPRRLDVDICSTTHRSRDTTPPGPPPDQIHHFLGSRLGVRSATESPLLVTASAAASTEHLALKPCLLLSKPCYLPSASKCGTNPTETRTGLKETPTSADILCRPGIKL